MSSELARIGGPLALAGLAALLVARPAWARLLGLAAWAVGMGLLVPLLLPEGNRGLLAGAGVAGLAVGALLAVLFRRAPWALPLLLLAAAPARIPVSVGRAEANLLLPLYAVVVGAALLLAWELLREEPRAREAGPLAWPLAALLFWSGLSLAWSDDVREGAIVVLFFLAPFGLLTVAVTRLPWRERAQAILVGLLGGMALLFALVGIGQWLAKDVFWNPKVVVGNQTEPFFRVNSLFWDPSMYGRFLVVAILSVLVLLVLRLCPRRWPWLTAGVGVVFAGLVFSYSQSSFVALAAGILVLLALAWRGRALAPLALAVAVALSLAAGPGERAAGAAGGPGDRGTLVREGLRIAVDHPVLGVGLGGFKVAYAERVEGVGPRLRTAASHTTPVTVAAETGFPGLLLLAWLVGAAAWAAFRAPASGARLARATSWAAGLAVVAIFVHSWFYNAFFEDPLLWGALGLVALAAGFRARERAS